MALHHSNQLPRCPHLLTSPDTDASPSTVNPCILDCVTKGASAGGCSGPTDFACLCGSGKQQSVTTAAQCLGA